MAENKKFWTGFEQLANTEVAQKMANNEFAEEIPTDEFLGNEEALESSSTSRRDFLKYLGFSTAAATVAACEGPVVKSIPYVVKPDEVTPGIPNFYATTYNDGADFASVLVKTREGRPIKVEPNNEAHFNGSTNARVQASVLSLYDSGRLKNPTKAGADIAWSKAMKDLKMALENAGDQEIVLLTSTIISPTTRMIIGSLKEKYPTFKHVMHDAVSVSEKLDFYEEGTGVRALPKYNFAKANLIVSFGSDFLNDLNGQSVEAEYAMRRNPGKDMSRHVQFEANMSLTGSNADTRVKIKPSEMGTAMVHLFNEVNGHTALPAKKLEATVMNAIKTVAKDLVDSRNRGKSIVVVGGNNYHHERMATAINFALDNLGETVVIADHVFLRQGNDKAVAELVSSMKAGKVAVLMTEGVNPSYNLPTALGFNEAMAKVGASFAFTNKIDETSSNMEYALPIHHNFERWEDALPKTGVYSITQPLISPLFDTKQFQSILLELLGENPDYYAFMKRTFDTKTSGLGYASFNQVLHDGTLEVPMSAEDLWTEQLNFLNNHTKEEFIFNLVVSVEAIKAEKAGQFELSTYQKAVGAGVQANNPWLHELPDPISRICYDNYVTMSAADAVELGIENTAQSDGAVNGSKVNITVNGQTLEGVPVLIQPGQTKGSLGLAVGYGRTAAGKVADNMGVNVYTVLSNGWSGDVTLEKVEELHPFASVQLAHTMMGRKIVNTTTLDNYLHNSDVQSWNEQPLFHTHKGHLPADEVTLWEELDHETGHMWNMSIDLNACNGCGACVVACHLENNVPVVGKEEIRKHRDMHWLRIDRYYSSDMSDEVAEEKGYEGLGIIGEGVIDKYLEMEKPSASPEVYFQPVMCQHCNHAPCETVCPVAATSHSIEGLNHMAYNRCIGTRYCANNCPYKVRRFNWFNYIANEQFSDVNPSQDDYGRMVLNPDVVVRSRGVMEKCSLCIQRIQYGKLEAKKAGRALKDGEVNTACSQACASGAMVFGDVNNKDSKVSHAKQDSRAYHLLEEIGVQPSVFYQTKIKNKA